MFTYTLNYMKEFFKKLFSDSTDVSGKRVAGLGGWFIFCGIILSSVAFSFKVTDQQENLMETLAYTSAILITGGTIETVFKGKQK